MGSTSNPRILFGSRDERGLEVTTNGWSVHAPSDAFEMVANDPKSHCLKIPLHPTIQDGLFSDPDSWTRCAMSTSCLNPLGHTDHRKYSLIKSGSFHLFVKSQPITQRDHSEKMRQPVVLVDIGSLTDLQYRLCGAYIRPNTVRPQPDPTSH